MLILASALGWLKSAFSALLGVIVRYPWQAALVAALCLTAWFWHGKRDALDERDAALSQVAEIIKASDEAERLAIAAREATEKRYRDIANAIDKEHSEKLADARSATDAFVDRNRVRAKVCPSQAVAASQGGGASVFAEVPAGIVVAESDVRTCGDLYTYAVSAHDWAAGLNH